ncbi:hypothetical protein B0H16DRAFT_1892098, partial [Mycena metata]
MPNRVSRSTSARFTTFSATAPPPHSLHSVLPKLTLLRTHSPTSHRTLPVYLLSTQASTGARKHRQRQRRSNKGKSAYLSVSFCYPTNLPQRAVRMYAVDCMPMILHGTAARYNAAACRLLPRPPLHVFPSPYPLSPSSSARLAVTSSISILRDTSCRCVRARRWRNAQRSWTPVSSSPSPSASSLHALPLVAVQRPHRPHAPLSFPLVPALRLHPRAQRPYGRGAFPTLLHLSHPHPRLPLVPPRARTLRTDAGIYSCVCARVRRPLAHRAAPRRSELADPAQVRSRARV